MLNRNNAAVDLNSSPLKSLTDTNVNEQQGKTEKPYWYDGVHSHKLVPLSNPTTRSPTSYCLDKENKRKADEACELKQTTSDTSLRLYRVWSEPPD